MAVQSDSPADGTYSVLHCHFESALRALSVVAPAELTHVRSVCSSPVFMRSGPAERLQLLDQQVRRRTAKTGIFSSGTLARVVRRLCDEMALSCIDHIDLRIGVITDRWSGIRDLAHAIEFFHQELAARDGLSISFLGAVNLSKPSESLDQIFDAVLQDARAAHALSGLDINMLPEDIHTFHRYRNTLGDLQKDGLRLSIHLGELLDNETSFRILSTLPPDRIGHGVRLLDHAEAMRIIGERDICLDMCPVSNTVLGVCDWRRLNPARRAMHLGIAVSINTDDPILFNAGLGENLALAGFNAREREAVRLASRKHRFR